MIDRQLLRELLDRASRTFALTIPTLPEPTRSEVAVAYLLFRIIDTFEDATNWHAAQRVAALSQFIALIERPDRRAAAGATAAWSAAPPLEHAGYLQLLACAPRVLDWLAELSPAARAQIAGHLIRTAHGMIEFVGRTDESGALRLETSQDLRDYCLAVAGIVGEMLTELYLLACPQLAGVAEPLRARATAFGEGLQLVNILKDARPDAAEGRVYLPRQLMIDEVFALARADLAAAMEYTEILRHAHADHGIVAFNALNARLALATLHALRERGPGAKLTRFQLSDLAAAVMSSIRGGGSLLPEA